jgi:hypothetical protein
VTVIGGLRARLLHDSVMDTIKSGLGALGWFDPGRSHRPIEFFATPQEWDREITANSMVITARSRVTDWVEVGSNLSRDTVVIGVDIYGDTDSLVMHLSNDVRDLMRCRFPFGPENGSLAILDFQMATPVPIGYAAIADVRVTRLRPQINRPFSQHWFGVDIELYDTYYSSS